MCLAFSAMMGLCTSLGCASGRVRTGTLLREVGLRVCTPVGPRERRDNRPYSVLGTLQPKRRPGWL